jgi:hypothetical protein
MKSPKHALGAFSFGAHLLPAKQVAPRAVGARSLPTHAVILYAKQFLIHIKIQLQFPID